MFRKRRSCYGVYDFFTTRNRRFDGFSLAFEANVKSVRSLNHVLSLNHVMRVKTFEGSSFFFFLCHTSIYGRNFDFNFPLSK